MLNFILNWVVLSAAFWGISYLMPGISVKSFSSSFLVAAIYAVLSAIVGKIFFVLFGVMTLGLGWLLAFVTWWIIGAIMLVFTDKLTSKFEVANFKVALVGSALMAVMTAIGQWVIGGLIA